MLPGDVPNRRRGEWRQRAREHAAALTPSCASGGQLHAGGCDECSGDAPLERGRELCDGQRYVPLRDAACGGRASAAKRAALRERWYVSGPRGCVELSPSPVRTNPARRGQRRPLTRPPAALGTGDPEPWGRVRTSRATPVYVDPPPGPSTKPDSDVSDKKQRSGVGRT